MRGDYNWTAIVVSVMIVVRSMSIYFIMFRHARVNSCFVVVVACQLVHMFLRKVSSSFEM